MGNEMVNIENSGFYHLDSQIGKGSKELYNSFQYKTDEFIKIYPIFVKFTNGEIDYDECVKALNEVFNTLTI